MKRSASNQAQAVPNNRLEASRRSLIAWRSRMHATAATRAPAMGTTVAAVASARDYGSQDVLTVVKSC